MGFLMRTALAWESFRSGNPLNNPAVPLGGPGFWAWLFAGDVTESGEQINDYTALQLITVYRCVRVLAESIGALPLKIYERDGKGRKESIDNPLYYLLRYQPNPEMVAVSFFETMVGCLALTGNSYAQIVRNGTGNVGGLYPLHPHKTKPVRVDQVLMYETSDGEPLGKSRKLMPKDILHFRLFSFDGILGLSPIQQAKQSIGLARAAEKYGARFFGNGSRPGGVLSPKMGQKLDEKQISQIKETWLTTQGGINQGKTAVLPGEWNYQQIGLSPEESQFLETRKFGRADIAGLFGVPPHMVGDTSRLSNSNHEQASLQFVTDTLRPYVTKIEQETDCKLVPRQGRNAGKFFIEMDVRERLRGDFKTTQEGYALGRQWGWWSANDILEDLGENPIGPAGDIRYAPVNMVNLETLLDAESEGDEPPSDPASEPGAVNSEGEGPEVQAQAEEKSLNQYLPGYIGLFRDALGRYLKREQRDSEGLSAAFGPSLAAIAAHFRDIWARKLDLEDDWDEVQGIIEDQLGAMVKRSAKWNPDGNRSGVRRGDQIAMAELTMALRAMNIETAKRAGIAAAKRKAVKIQ